MKELKDLKEGDVVIVNKGGYHPSLALVKRTTGKHLDVHGWLYRKDNGCLRGGSSFDTRRISVPKEGEVEKIREGVLNRKNIAWLQKMQWEILGPHGVSEVKEMVEDKIKELNVVERNGNSD